MIALGLIAAALAGCQGQKGTQVGAPQSEEKTSTAAAAPPASEAVALRLAGKPGTKLTMEMTMEMTMEGGTNPQGGTAPEGSMKVVQRSTGELISNADDKISWKWTTDEVKATGTGVMASMGPMFEQRKGQVVTTVYDPRGKVLSREPAGTDGGEQEFVLPEQPVRIGDSWKGTSTAGTQQMEMTYKLVGLEDLEGEPVYKVEGKIRRQGSTVEMPMTFWMSRELGMPMKIESELEQPSPNGGKARIKLSSRTRRV